MDTVLEGSFVSQVKMLRMKKQNIRTLALIVTTFTYLLVGAAIYDALESKNEESERDRLNDEALSIQQQYNITDEDFEKLRVNILKSKPYRAGTQWSFAGSFYFSLSVITTIGYGHSTPRTFGGKSFCIVYALIGIPLNIVMFQSIGERFNMGITIVLRKCKQCCHLKRAEVSQTELTMLALILCSMVLLGGAAAFWYFEGWHFFDAFYYCFITMSTIGFGDFVALQNNTMNALQLRPDYVAFSILYIIFGLTVFAAALNLMVLKLLTMNTEDERKDELEALAAARGIAVVDGDIIRKTLSSQTKDIEGINIEVSESSTNRSIQPNGLNKEHTTLDMNADSSIIPKPLAIIGRSPFMYNNIVSVESSNFSMVDDDTSTHSESLHSISDEHLPSHITKERILMKRGSV